MPLRIELENLWRRLATRFKARRAGEEEEGYPILLETLQPITNFDELAKTPTIDAISKDISAGTGNTTYFTVPEGKRWKIKALARGATTGNSYVFLKDHLTNVAYPLDANGTAAMRENNLDITLIEADTIGMKNTGDGADTAINVTVVYEEEDAF